MNKRIHITTFICCLFAGLPGASFAANDAATQDQASWQTSASSIMRKASTMDMAGTVVAPSASHGRLLSRRLVSSEHQTTDTTSGQLRSIEYVFKSQYTRKDAVREMMRFELQDDHWQIVDYRILP